MKCLMQSVGISDVAFILYTANQYTTSILQLEEVQAELILGKDAVEQFGKTGSTYEQYSRFLDMVCISDGIVKAVNDSLQLCTQTIEIHRRGYHQHICYSHLIIDETHIVFLNTSIVLILETSITAHARVDLIVMNRYYLDMMLLRCTLDKCFHQQFSIAAPSWTTRKNQYIHKTVIPIIFVMPSVLFQQE